MTRVRKVIQELDIKQFDSFVRAKRDATKQELALLNVDKLVRAFLLDMDDHGKDHNEAVKYLEAIKPTYGKSPVYKIMTKRTREAVELLDKYYNTKGNKVALVKELRTRGFKV